MVSYGAPLIRTRFTHCLELVVGVCDASSIEFRPQIVRRDDVAGDARERAGAHANEEPLPSHWCLDDLHRAHSPSLLLFPRQSIDDLLVHCKGNRVIRIPIGVSLGNHRARCLVQSLVSKPSRRLRDERQDENAHDGEDSLEQRRGPPRPGGLPLARSERDTSCDERADVVEVVEKPDAPGPPPAGEGLGEVDTRRDTGDAAPEPQDDPPDDEHGDVLRRGLENYPDDGDERAPENGRAAAEAVRGHAGHERPEETADEHGSGVEACGGSIELEVISVGGQDVEPIEHGAIISAGLQVLVVVV